MNLAVPLIRQAKGSSDCGVACIGMILKYYGIKKSIEEIKKDVEVFEGGTYMPQLGNYFLSQNFEVEIITMNPHLFNASFKKTSQKKMLSYLQNKLEAVQKENQKRCITFFIEFLQAGGKLTIAPPTTVNIKSEMKHKRPALALLTSAVLSKKAIQFNFHYNVITGIDSKHIIVNDPGAGVLGGKHTYPIDDYLYALYASAHGEGDNASMMKIRYKK